VHKHWNNLKCWRLQDNFEKKKNENQMKFRWYHYETQNQFEWFGVEPVTHVCCKVM